MTGLREHAEGYLAMRRKLGFALDGHGRMLMGFIDYLEETGATTVTTDLAVAWATRTAPGANPASWNKRLPWRGSSPGTCTPSTRPHRSRLRT
ncbi:hypothetical protein [Streptomyces sp. NPDC051677]|uniref:hypothetical protein n=1 Tax=Streptomyces sp. NPDC051677 TaxID=3365669 RepID=UPI0037D96AB6